MLAIFCTCIFLTWCVCVHTLLTLYVYATANLSCFSTIETRVASDAGNASNEAYATNARKYAADASDETTN